MIPELAINDPRFRTEMSPNAALPSVLPTRQNMAQVTPITQPPQQTVQPMSKDRIYTQPAMPSDPTVPAFDGSPEAYTTTMQTSAPQPTPAYGLGGAEMALGAGLEGALNILNMGNPNLGQSPQLGVAPQVGSVSLGGAPMANLGQAVANLQGFDPGISNVEQFTGAGAAAQQLQAALTGALGPEAQAQAIQQYNQSPGLQYAMEQSERAITRNAAATGGSKGGNVLKELQRNAIGLYQQDFNNRVNQLGSQAAMGLNAAGHGAQLRGQQATTGSQLMAQEALANQAIQGQYDMLGAQLAQQSDLANQDLRSRYDLNQAQLQQQRDLTGAQLGAQLAGQGANITQNVMGRTADLRYGTGQQIAQQANQTYNALAGLANEQGINLSNLVGEGGRNIANLQQATGGAFSEMPRSLQTLLANLATQQGTQQAMLTTGIGAAQGAGVQAGYNAITNTVGTLGDIVGDWINQPPANTPSTQPRPGFGG